MKVKTLNLPILSSLPPHKPDDSIQEHMIYWAVEMAHAIEEDCFTKINIVCPTDEQREYQASWLTTMLKDRGIPV